MAETKQITSVFVVTDSETRYDNIGDIQGGGFDKQWLKSHIKAFGRDGLLRTISYMNYQVHDAFRQVNAELDDEIGNQIPNENK